MKPLSFDRQTFVPNGNIEDVTFANADIVAARRIYESSSEYTKMQNAWYYAHRLRPDFGYEYDDSKPRYEDNSGPLRLRTTPETAERIAVARHFIVGDLAMKIGRPSWYLNNWSRETFCGALSSIFYKGEVYQTADGVPSKKPIEMIQYKDRVEKVDNLARGLAYVLQNKRTWVGPDDHKSMMQIFTTQEKMDSFFRLAGFHIQDMTAPEEERIVAWSTKRISNDTIARGIVVSDFPELWLPEEHIKVHRTIMKNATEIITEALMLNGIDEKESVKWANKRFEY